MSPSRPSQAGGESETIAASPGRVPGLPRRVWQESDFKPAVPEALASPAIVWVRHADVLGDPHNIRDSLPSVQRLAWSIFQHGLLENLLVVELPPERVRQTGQHYELRAGSRRFEAIRQLIEGVEAPPNTPDRERGLKWRWPADKPIPVLVLGSDGHYEHLIENVERSEPLPWEIGRRISEVLGAGITTRELGLRIGRSSGWVTRYGGIGRGLAPELIELLRKERTEVKLGELVQLATIRDPYGDPDGPAQIAEFQRRRSKRRSRPRRTDPHSFRSTLKRLQYLRSDMPVPPLIRPVVTALIDYLEGGAPPKFRQLETQLFDQLRAFSPDHEAPEAEEP